MFRAFGNSAGLLLFACSVALKTLCASIVFSLALTSRAGGVVINSRILGHNESPFLELCYALLLALRGQGHKRQFQPRISQLWRARLTVHVYPPPAPAPPVPSTLPFCLSAHAPPPQLNVPGVSLDVVGLHPPMQPALLLPHNVHAFIETDTSMTTSVRAYNKIYAFEHTSTLTHKNYARYKTLP